MKHSAAFEKLAEDAKARVSEISPKEVLQKIKGNHPFKFIDVREDHEWLAGHAENAIHLGRGIIERDIEKLVPNYKEEIVLYCGGGYRSALAGDNLQKMGYTNVFSMAGGIRAWRELGFAEQKN